MRSKTWFLAACAASLLLAAPAQAHVTLQPNEVSAGGFTRLDVRVPTERDDAATTKVDVRFPSGFAFASYEPVEGWSVKVRRKKLERPIEVEGEKITEEVSRITWTAGGGGVDPGQFQDFGLSLRIPDKPGTLTFKALQTYEGGEVVRWIGPPDADEPAPQVTVAAAEDEDGAAAAETEAAGDDDEEDDDDSEVLPVIALIAGALGLVTGGAALARGRRRG